MSNNKENIHVVNINTFVLLLILVFGLLLYDNSHNNPPDRDNNSKTIEISLSQNLAVCSSGIQFRIFQKTWISNNKNFRLLSFYKDPLLENRDANLKISLLENIRNKIFKIPVSIFYYHLFPAENDEIPVLS